MRYDGYVIYTDLDGTIRNSKGEISEKDREKIKYFQDNGGRFAFATGRGAEHVKKIGISCNAPLIAINGTYVTDIKTGDELTAFAADGAKNVFSYVRENYKNIFDVYFFFRDGDCFLSEYKGNTEELFLKSVLKIVFKFEQENDALAFQKDMSKRFSDKYVFERSWPVGVEMVSNKGGKGNAVEFVRRFYGKKVHTIICAGNYENDISMIRAADVGVAVDNATEPVKAAADVIAPNCDLDPISWIIDNIEQISHRLPGQSSDKVF